MKRFQRLTAEDLQLELATAVHERECAKLAAIVNRAPMRGIITATTGKINTLRELLANGAQ